MRGTRETLLCRDVSKCGRRCTLDAGGNSYRPRQLYISVMDPAARVTLRQGVPSSIHDAHTILLRPEGLITEANTRAFFYRLCCTVKRNRDTAAAYF